MSSNFFGNPAQPIASGSSFNSKRKRTSWCVEDYSYEQIKQIRVLSPPPFDRRHTYAAPPELIEDSSSSPPTSSVAEDQMMDLDGDAEMLDGTNGGRGGFEFENGAVDHARVRADSTGSNPAGQAYAFGEGGSGGFGFGPGAMEDEDPEGAGSNGWNKSTYPYPIYPSLTPHPNPNHFSNPAFAQPSSLRPKSPLSAQAFSTSLRAPASPRPDHAARTVGLLQPAFSAPVSHHASDIEKARSAHGPQCKSIPKLVMSQYADPVTGGRSLWSQCGDCGAIERKM